MSDLDKIRERVKAGLDRLAVEIGRDNALEHDLGGITYQELIEIIALLGISQEAPKGERARLF